MKNLTASFDYRDETTYLYLNGNIDESAELPEAHKTQPKELCIDLKKVVYINSAGIKLWTEWMDNLITSLPNTQIRLRSCPKVIVSQINSILNFCPPSVEVESFFVPFYCDPCDFCKDVLYTEGKEFKRGESAEDIQHPEEECPQCNGYMELDVVPETYFSFLNR